MAVRNITVAVDDDVYAQARVKAAEQATTVSALVREFLNAYVHGGATFDALEAQQQAIIARMRAQHAGFAAGVREPRERLHERWAPDR
ncbi:MAG: type II toxin-antitoxin system RelB/DinJ family antitoxin [Gemmatimonadaceae bacterium]|jgi:plasmid stability protein|nr:type II toxin-antitoxin system RelB/DinJ family antitoxin [Gemmatimonadaceae bacterium]